MPHLRCKCIFYKEILGNKTKEIILAHISEEANTPEIALKAYKKIFAYYGLNIDQFNVRVANQYKSLLGGSNEDKDNSHRKN